MVLPVAKFVRCRKLLAFMPWKYAHLLLSWIGYDLYDRVVSVRQKCGRHKQGGEPHDKNARQMIIVAPPTRTLLLTQNFCRTFGGHNGAEGLPSRSAS
jgi:hypothetical protein